MIVMFSRLLLQTLDLQFPYGKMTGQGRLLKVLILTFFPSPKSQIAPSNFFLESELYRVFFLPLSVQASDQLSELLGIINDKDWNQNQSDSWTYSWGPAFSTKKAYSLLQGTLQASPLFASIWTSSNLGKHKFLA